VLGENGQGKTNLLEAVGWLAALTSFRGAGNDALVRSGASSAVIRATGRVEREGQGTNEGRAGSVTSQISCAEFPRVRMR